MLPDSLGCLFDEVLTLSPSTPAVFQGDHVITFAELDARTHCAANALAALGIGDRVDLMLANDFPFLESLFGPMRLDALPVPLNTSTTLFGTMRAGCVRVPLNGPPKLIADRPELSATTKHEILAGGAMRFYVLS